MERTVQAPDWDYGDAKQCADYLGIDKTAFQASVDAGKIPPGVKWNRQNIMWRWDVICAVSVLGSWLIDEPQENPVKPS